MIWSSLQDEHDTLHENHPGSPQDDEREEVCADGVKVPALGPDENDGRSNNHTR